MHFTISRIGSSLRITYRENDPEPNVGGGFTCLRNQESSALRAHCTWRTRMYVLVVMKIDGPGKILRGQRSVFGICCVACISNYICSAVHGPIDGRIDHSDRRSVEAGYGKVC